MSESSKSGLDQVTLTAGDKSVTLPVHHPTLGAPCIDIAKLPKETGCFTYDNGFTATASCRSAITYIDGDAGVLLYRGYPIVQLVERAAGAARGGRPRPGCRRGPPRRPIRRPA